MDIIFAILGMFFLSIVGTFVRGLCISSMWSWFISPVFQIRYINLYEAVGISLFFSMLFPFNLAAKNSIEKDSSASNIFFTGVGVSIIGPIVSLILSYFWYSFFIAQ